MIHDIFYNTYVATYSFCWATPREHVCARFLFSLFFFSSFFRRVKLSGSSCRVSAPQGKDYFIMKPTHMLVLLLVWLPNGLTLKGAGSHEVHEVWETPGETQEKKKEREWEQLAANLLHNRKANMKRWGNLLDVWNQKEMCTGMWCESRKTPDPPWEMSNVAGTHSVNPAGNTCPAASSIQVVRCGF